MSRQVIEGNRHYIESIAEIILLCAHEEMALRGHNEGIQNESISVVLERISKEVQEAQYYSLLVDETRDISKIEQISIMVRYALNRSVYERFLGYVAAKELNAEALAGYIISFLTQVGLSLQNCVC